MNKPFLMIPRELIESYAARGNILKIFLWMLNQANYSDTQFCGMTIHRGQLVASYSTICKATGSSIRQVRDTVEVMVTSRLVSRLVVSQKQVFTIVSYDSYCGQGQGEGHGYVTVEGTVPTRLGHHNNIDIDIKEVTPARPELTEWFTAFFREYPNKNHQTEAFAEFTKMNPDTKMMSELYEALLHYKNSIAWSNEDGRFVPRMDKWLREEQWKRKVPQLPDPYNGLKNFDLSEE